LPEAEHVVVFVQCRETGCDACAALDLPLVLGVREFRAR
jgi:hypothetical protein